MCEISNICAKYSRPKQCRLNMTTILLAGAGQIVEVTNTCMIQHSTRKQGNKETIHDAHKII